LFSKKVEEIFNKIKYPGKETLPGAIFHYSADQNPLSRVVNFSKIQRGAQKKAKSPHQILVWGQAKSRALRCGSEQRISYEMDNILSNKFLFCLNLKKIGLKI
jgi:hypothetical protein